MSTQVTQAEIEDIKTLIALPILRIDQARSIQERIGSKLTLRRLRKHPQITAPNRQEVDLRLPRLIPGRRVAVCHPVGDHSLIHLGL